MAKKSFMNSFMISFSISYDSVKNSIFGPNIKNISQLNHAQPRTEPTDFQTSRLSANPEICQFLAVLEIRDLCGMVPKPSQFQDIPQIMKFLNSWPFLKFTISVE